MAKKKSAKTKRIALPPELPTDTLPTVEQQPRLHGFQAKWKYVLILAGLLVLLFLTNKGLLLAAVVNGKPIFSWELNHSLRARFGQQTLEGMVGEVLIADEARKAGVSVSKAELDAKEAEVIKSLGPNVKLEDILKFQGMTKEDFDGQIRLQMLIEKVLGKDLQITETDIDNFIASSGATLTATDPAQLRVDARAAIVSQKVSEKVQQWFMDLKAKAKVLRFL